MRATNIKASRGAVATIHSGSDRRKKSKTIESTLDQVPGDFHSKYNARARTLVTKMMFWALAGVTFSAAKIVSRNKNFFSWSTFDITSIVLLYSKATSSLQPYYFRNGSVYKLPKLDINQDGPNGGKLIEVREKDIQVVNLYNDQIYVAVILHPPSAAGSSNNAAHYQVLKFHSNKG
jgi:hypothetical protein